jgi:hypothetical protein
MEKHDIIFKLYLNISGSSFEVALASEYGTLIQILGFFSPSVAFGLSQKGMH